MGPYEQIQWVKERFRPKGLKIASQLEDFGGRNPILGEEKVLFLKDDDLTPWICFYGPNKQPCEMVLKNFHYLTFYPHFRDFFGLLKS